MLLVSLTVAGISVSYVMESMECTAASAAVAATELVQQSASDQYPMMPPASVPQPSDNLVYRLANFEIEKKIGRGQFSTVYRARCRSNGTIVALKKVQVRNGRSFYCYHTDYLLPMSVQL